MSPLQFEQLYQNDWNELDALLAQLQGRRRKGETKQPISGERVAQLYRRACEHLALARARAYPAHIIERLDQLTADAHQAIYSRREFGLLRLVNLIRYDFPRSVRAHAKYVWLSTLVFVLPTLILGLLVYDRPELILSIVDAETASNFEEMYSPEAESIGRRRDANTDMAMFGFYIRNNIGVSFQCFASGLLLGIGSLFFLAFNGVYAGAIAGYLTERGLSETFYSFVVTHASFELTAIVLSGAAGLRIGHAILAPRRQTRTQALVAAARESIVMVYGVIGMLLIAAAIEAFWSSQRWIPLTVKYGVAGLCWLAVIGYLALQGRRAS